MGDLELSTKIANPLHPLVYSLMHQTETDTSRMALALHIKVKVEMMKATVLTQLKIFFITSHRIA